MCCCSLDTSTRACTVSTLPAEPFPALSLSCFVPLQQLFPDFISVLSHCGAILCFVYGIWNPSSFLMCTQTLLHTCPHSCNLQGRSGSVSAPQCHVAHLSTPSELAHCPRWVLFYATPCFLALQALAFCSLLPAWSLNGAMSSCWSSAESTACGAIFQKDNFTHELQRKECPV